MSHIVKISLALLGLTLSAAVLLHSLHAAQLLGMAITDTRVDAKKIVHDDVRPELHNHHDKQPASSLLKTFSGDPANLVDRTNRVARKRRTGHSPWDLDWLHDLLHFRQHELLQ